VKVVNKKKGEYMKKNKWTKKFRSVISTCVVKYIIILSVISFCNIALVEGGSDSPFKGTFSGEYNGDVMGMSVWGSFTITISADGTVSGKYKGYGDGAISGTVSESGGINAKGSAEIAKWTGTISIKDGRLSAKGTWEGLNGGGRWWSK
jgi:hypothetical protein